MSNLVIKCRLHIERYIQYNLFEPKKMIMKCLFSTWRTIYYMYDFSRNIVEKYPNFSQNAPFSDFEHVYGYINDLIVYQWKGLAGSVILSIYLNL